MATVEAFEGRLHAEDSHVRFDECEVASTAKSRCDALLTVRSVAIAAFVGVAAVVVCQAGWQLRPASSADYEPRSATTETDDWDGESNAIDLSELEAGDTFVFSLEEDLPETINGLEVLTDFLPDGVELEWTGKKLKAPKAGKVKYSKSEEDFVDTKDSENPSGLSVKLNKKKGTVSGSFKIYLVKGETKLKSVKAKFSGKAGKSMAIRVKNTVVATAVIE